MSLAECAGMLRAAVLLLLPACLSLGPDHPPTARAAGIAGGVGLAANAAAILGAYEASDRRGSSIAYETAIGTAAAILPAAVLFAGPPQAPPHGIGEAWQQIFRGLFGTLGAGIASIAPMVATFEAGQHFDGARDRSGAMFGVGLGTITATTISLLLADHVPRWALVPLSASLTGTLATLGYQLGSGGRP